MDNKKEVKKITENYHILVIGAGGTGTYFLKEFNHFLARNKSAWSRIKNIWIADGDMVEEKNLDRQCYCVEDIGANKALTFSSLLNDALEEYTTSSAFSLKWKALPEYITSVQQLQRILNIRSFESYTPYSQTLTLDIPVIIGCVDNNACRKVCEDFFNASDYCIYYDAGNDFATGEVSYAHKFHGKKLSYEKSYSFPNMFDKDMKSVTELSCEELNHSAPQHMLTNITAAQWLLRGIVNLFNNTSDPLPKRVSGFLGFIWFDAFSGASQFVERSIRTESEQPGIEEAS